jgi:signal transduction histidine kinase
LQTTDPSLLHRLSVIDESSHHLLAVINDILDISNLESQRLTLESKGFKLGAMLKNIASTLRHKATDKGLQFEIEVMPEMHDLSLQGDPLRLEQVLLNLADNAVKFTERGTISLRSQFADLGSNRVSLSFHVQDTGIGIANKDLIRLFYPFEQGDGSTTRKYGGTGLGLVISKRLAELMGGDIQVISEPGVGSTFTFTLQLDRTSGN